VTARLDGGPDNISSKLLDGCVAVIVYLDVQAAFGIYEGAVAVRSLVDGHGIAPVKVAGPPSEISAVTWVHP
jgi:hypothetical protein